MLVFCFAVLDWTRYKKVLEASNNIKNLLSFENSGSIVGTKRIYVRV